MDVVVSVELTPSDKSSLRYTVCTLKNTSKELVVRTHTQRRCNNINPARRDGKAHCVGVCVCRVASVMVQICIRSSGKINIDNVRRVGGLWAYSAVAARLTCSHPHCENTSSAVISTMKPVRGRVVSGVGVALQIKLSYKGIAPHICEHAHIHVTQGSNDTRVTMS